MAVDVTVFFKSKISEFKNNTMAELHVQKKRNNYWWLWLIIALIVIAAGIYYYMNYYHKNNNTVTGRVTNTSRENAANNYQLNNGSTVTIPARKGNRVFCIETDRC